MNAAADKNAMALCWPGRLLCEEDLRRHWTSQGEIILAPGTLVTPLAWDWLRARRVRVRRDDVKPDAGRANQAGTWAYAEESPSALVASAVKALAQQGRTLAELPGPKGAVASWVRTLAEALARGDAAGLCLFCREPALAVCLANKTAGVRAASVLRPAQVDAVRQALGPNLYAVPLLDLTYFEMRHMLQRATASTPACPADLRTTLEELERHAHR